MVNHRTLGIAAFATLLAILFCQALMGLESSLLSERLVYFQRADPASKPALDATVAAVKSSLLTNQRAITSKTQNNDAAVPHSAMDEAIAVDKARLEASEKWSSRSNQSQADLQDRSPGNNYLFLIQIHLIWIGDLSKAPKDRLEYIETSYNLTVHTSAEEILVGFHPYVLKAYRQAIPKVVGYDFLKFTLLYKYGGFAVDADTSPAVPACEIKWPSDCDVIFGKEGVQFGEWEKPMFRQQGDPTYGLIRPF